MTRGPEDQLMDSVAEALQMFGYLVYHQRSTDRGTPVQYDGAGFPDIVARKPGHPTIAVECKVNTPMTADQIDWQLAFQGDDCYYALVTPATYPAFLKHVTIVGRRPAGIAGWAERLAQRQWRIAKKKEAKRAHRATTPKGSR